MEERKPLHYWKKMFEDEDAWGILTSIDLHDCDPVIIRDADKIREYVDLLCRKNGMRKFGKTVVVHFGDDENVAGFSMTQLIDASLISGHFANQTNRVFIDVFSCAFYNPDDVAVFTKKFFKSRDYNMHVVLRK